MLYAFFLQELSIIASLCESVSEIQSIALLLFQKFRSPGPKCEISMVLTQLIQGYTGWFIQSRDDLDRLAHLNWMNGDKHREGTTKLFHVCRMVFLKVKVQVMILAIILSFRLSVIN